MATGKTPADGAIGVLKNAAITFLAGGAEYNSGVINGGVINGGQFVDVFVRGELAYSIASNEFMEGWRGSTFQPAIGVFTLRPARSKYYRDGEIVKVRLDLAGVVQDSWSFTAAPQAVPRTFKMLLGSVRRSS